MSFLSSEHICSTIFFSFPWANPNLGLARNNEARTRYRPEKIMTRPDPTRQKVDPNPTRKKDSSLGSARPDVGLRDPTTRSGWPGPCRALTATYLDIDIQEHLQWNHHIDKLCSRLSFKVSKLTRLRQYTPPRVLRKIYFACIQPTIDYAITVWGNAPLCYLQNVQRLQNFAGRVLANDFDYVNSRGIDILKSQRIMNVKQRFIYFSLVQMFKCIHGLAPDYLCDQVLMACEVNDRSTRFCDFNNVYVPFPRKELLKKTFIYNAGCLWNKMPNHLKEISDLSVFKNALRCYVFMSF